MIMPARPRRLLAALAAVLCLTACGGGDGGNANGAATPTAWPQPVDGTLTDAMCDVLTTDDFLSVGVHAMRWEDRGPSPDVGPNAVTCHALGGHFFGLNLQPDPVSAGLYFRWLLGQSARKGTVATGGTTVAGADETWSAAGGDGYDLLVRRGSLIISLTLGFLHDDTGFDPARAATTLAGQALERMPGVGRAATGEPHEMVMTVTGSNTTNATIMYVGPLDTEVTQETVALPWSKTFQFPALGRSGRSATLSGYVTTPSLTTLPLVSCTITVDGAPEAEGRPGPSTSCRASTTGKG